MKYTKKAQWFILKKTLIKETWAFFDIFTKEDWKKSFFIFNIKKSKTIKPAYLWLWNEIEFIFSSKKNIETISDVKLINSFGSLDLESLKIISYFLELITKLTVKNSPNIELFLLKKTVFKLIFFWVNKDKIRLFFEIKILSILWFLWELNKFIDTNKKIILDKNIAFDLENWWFISNFENINNIVFLEPFLVKIVNFYKVWNIEKIFKINIENKDFLKIKNLFKTIIKIHCPTKLKTDYC